MEFQNKIVVVIGGVLGIGFVFVICFVQEGVIVIIFDCNVEVGVQKVQEIGVCFIFVDISCEEGVQVIIENVLVQEGCIDLFCLNVGVVQGEGLEMFDKVWDFVYCINVMSYVWVVWYLLLYFLECGEGYFLNIVLVVGLFIELYLVFYVVMKYVVFVFVEWLVVIYGDWGIKVICLCFEGVWILMVQNVLILQQIVIIIDEFVEKVLEVLWVDGFLIIIYDIIFKFFCNKVENYDVWISKMCYLWIKVMVFVEVYVVQVFQVVVEVVVGQVFCIEGYL